MSIRFDVVSGEIGKGKEPLLLGVAEETKLPVWAKAWPNSIRRTVEDLLRSKRFLAKLNETFLFQNESRWVVVVGAGKTKELTLERVRQAAGTGARRLLDAGFEEFARGLVQVPGATTDQAAQAVTEGTILGTYRYSELKTTL